MSQALIERRYSRLTRAIESARVLGTRSEDLLGAELLPLEPSLGSPLARGRPRDRQLAEQLRNGTAILTIGEGAVARRIPLEIGRLAVAVSDRIGIGEAEAAELVLSWADELVTVSVGGVREAVTGTDPALVSYIEEQYLRERWALLQALWLILATPFLDPQTGTAVAARPQRNGTRTAERQPASPLPWTQIECLLQTRRRLVSDYKLVSKLLERLETPESLFPGERRALAQCLFTLAYSIQFTAADAMSLTNLFKRFVLSIGSGISGNDSKAQITRGPLQGCGLFEAIDVLMLMSLSLRGVLDPTRYHPLEDLNHERAASGLFSANKLLEDEAFVTDLVHSLENWYVDLADASADSTWMHRTALAAEASGTKQAPSGAVAHSESVTTWQRHAANLVHLLEPVPLVGALFLIGTPEAGKNAVLVQKYLEMAYQSLQRGALTAILEHWVPWLDQQPGLNGDALRRPGVGALAPLTVDLFADLVMDLGAAGLVTRVFETAARAMADVDLWDKSAIPRHGSRHELDPRLQAPADTAAATHRGLETALCAQIVQVLAAGARLAPANAYRFVTEPMGEFQVDLIRIVGDACLELVELLYARITGEDLLVAAGDQGSLTILDERIASVSFPMITAFLELLRYTAVCAEPVWDFLENGGHPVASYAYLMHGLDAMANRWAVPAGTFSLPQLRHAAVLAGLIRILTVLTEVSPEIATLLRSEGALVEHCIRLISDRLPTVVQRAAAEWLVQLGERGPAAATLQLQRALQQQGIFQTSFAVLQEAFWRARETGDCGFLTSLLRLAALGVASDASACARYAITQILGIWDRFVAFDFTDGWALTAALMELVHTVLDVERHSEQNVPAAAGAGAGAAPESIWALLQRPSEVTGAASSASRTMFAIAARACLVLRDDWWCPSTAQEAAVCALRVLCRLVAEEPVPSSAVTASRRAIDAGQQVAALLAQCTEQTLVLCSVIHASLSGNDLVIAAATLLTMLCRHAPAVATTLADHSLFSRQCAQILLSSTDDRLLRAVGELLSSCVYAGAQSSTWPRPSFLPFGPRVHPAGRRLVGIGPYHVRVGAPFMAVLQRLWQLVEWPVAAVATPLFQLLQSLLSAPELVMQLAPELLPRSEISRRSILTLWLRVLCETQVPQMDRVQQQEHEMQQLQLMTSVLEVVGLALHCAGPESSLSDIAGPEAMPGILRSLARDLLGLFATPLLKRICAFSNAGVSAHVVHQALGAWHKAIAASFEHWLSWDSDTRSETHTDVAATFVGISLTLEEALSGLQPPKAAASTFTEPLSTTPVLDANAAAALVTICRSCRTFWYQVMASDALATTKDAEMTAARHPQTDGTGASGAAVAADEALHRMASVAVAIAGAVAPAAAAAAAAAQQNTPTETRRSLYAAQCALIEMLVPLPLTLNAMDAPVHLSKWNCQPEHRVNKITGQLVRYFQASTTSLARFEQQTAVWITDASADGEAALRAIALATLTYALQMSTAVAVQVAGEAVPAISTPGERVLANRDASSSSHRHPQVPVQANRFAHMMMIGQASAMARLGLCAAALGEDAVIGHEGSSVTHVSLAVRNLYLFEQHLSLFVQLAVSAARQGTTIRLLPSLLEALHAWVRQGVDSGALLFPVVVSLAQRSGNISPLLQRRAVLVRRLIMFAALLALQLPSGVATAAPSWRALVEIALQLGSLWLASRSLMHTEHALTTLQIGIWYGRLLCALPAALYAEQSALEAMRHSFVLQCVELLPHQAGAVHEPDTATRGDVAGIAGAVTVGTAPWDATRSAADAVLTTSLPRWHRNCEHPESPAGTPQALNGSHAAPGPNDNRIQSFLLCRLELLRIMLELNMHEKVPGVSGWSDPVPGGDTIRTSPLAQFIAGSAGSAALPAPPRIRAEHLSLGLLRLASECITAERAQRGASHRNAAAGPRWALERQQQLEAMRYREVLERTLWFLLAIFEPSPAGVAVPWQVASQRTRHWIDWLYQELETHRDDARWLLRRLLARRLRQWIPGAPAPTVRSAGTRSPPVVRA